MVSKVNVECPHCGQMFAQDIAGLIPGRFQNCPNCKNPVRFTARDLRHLQEALRRSKRKRGD